MRRYLIGDFLWIDDNKDLGVDVPKMLEYMGQPDTRENRDLAAEALKEIFAELYPDIPHYETSIAKGFQKVHKPTRQN
jgi:hypothetical protein